MPIVDPRMSEITSLFNGSLSSNCPAAAAMNKTIIQVMASPANINAFTEKEFL
jgi:hypothetical protein